MKPLSFFAELRRRNVYKAAVAYAVFSWLLIQFATQVFPFFEIPSWAVRLVILLLILGTPIVVFFAWAFEITPEGIKRTEEVPPGKSITHRTGRKLMVGIAIIVALALAMEAFHLARRTPLRGSGKSAQAESVVPEKSIAVLPFENLSDEKNNAYFADGIQDDVLTSLAKIQDLKVISRTSTLLYGGKETPNLRTIRRELGVASVLEGSVRRAGNRVLVNVQLVNTASGGYLWAERYDRTLADSLSLQGELATEIASALRATLSPREKALMETKPTDNPDAYLFYLRARIHHTRQSARLQDLLAAEQLYEEAIALDQNFALAHARLSETVSRIHHWYQPTSARAAKARREAETALRLRPHLGEGRLALGLCRYWAEGNYEAGLREFAAAAKALPNDSAPELYIASIRRRQGRWSEAVVGFRRALEIDPRNAEIALQLANCYFFLRDWVTAREAWDRAVVLQPDELYPRRFRAYVDFLAFGNPASYKAVLAGAPAAADSEGLISLSRWNVSLMERDFDAAERAVDGCPVAAIAAVSGPPIPKSYLQGCIALARGDSERAKNYLELARSTFETEVNASPDNAERHAYLGLVYAFRGRKDDAIREGRRAVELKPESRDALDGAQIAGFLALIYARTGQNDAALSLIQRLLSTPAAVDDFQESITLTDLRLRWEWDPLRADPRFQAIVAGPEPKTISL